MDVLKVYEALHTRFGPQHWWPRHTEPQRPGFDPTWEVLAGCILTQNTAWINVEKAIANLYREGVLDCAATRNADDERLCALIRPAGYFNQKAKKLKALANVIENDFANENRFSIENSFSFITTITRPALLNVWGIGPETADSMLLYAGNRPEFVIDTYTKRLCATYGVSYPHYQNYKDFFESALPRDARLFNEYHALIVAWGKISRL